MHLLSPIVMVLARRDPAAVHIFDLPYDFCVSVFPVFSAL
jgi:hypothetical protein